jgi:hypothetical protein
MTRRIQGCFALLQSAGGSESKPVHNRTVAFFFWTHLAARAAAGAQWTDVAVGRKAKYSVAVTRRT